MSESPTPQGPPWFDEIQHTQPDTWWRHRQHLIWTAVIIAVVIGLGIWDVITHGPIHPHI